MVTMRLGIWSKATIYSVLLSTDTPRVAQEMFTPDLPEPEGAGDPRDLFEVQRPTGSGSAGWGFSRQKRPKKLLIAVGFILAAVVGVVAFPTDARPVLRRETRNQPVRMQESGTPKLIGLIPGSHLEESSGLVASPTQDGVLWTHNDSGGSPSIHCITTGAGTCGSWEVTGSRAIDWESISAGPGPRTGRTYLYVGDIGDNGENRETVVVYRLPEPRVGATSGPTTARAVPLEFRYPDRPQDAEALLIHPATGDLYIVTKEATGSGSVFKSSWAPLARRFQPLRRVARLPKFAGISSVTGGDISTDGSAVILSTYAAAFEFTAPRGLGRFDEVWRAKPRRITLGLRVQGESIAYSPDGDSVFATSEMTPVPLWRTVIRERP